MGEKSYFNIEYNVSNSDETAYFVQIYITLPNDTFFIKTPNNCNGTNSSMICYHTTALYEGETYSQTIMVRTDAINTKVSNLTIQANVSSKSAESNPNDNMITNSILLIASSNFEVTG